MKRLLLWGIVVIGVATLLGMAIAKSPGYVLIAYDHFRFEASLWATLALLVAVCVLLWVLRLLQRALWASMGWINPWSKQRHARRVGAAAHAGILELTEGRWEAALKHLKQAASHERQPLPYYLGAARAANELGQVQVRDDLLLEALERDPKSHVAVGLTRARLLIDQGEYLQARETLEDLHSAHDRQNEVLRLLQQLYVHLKDWQALTVLLPQMRKYKVLNMSDLDLLENEVWLARLREVAPEASLKSLEELWARVPAHIKRQPEVIGAYAHKLHLNEQNDQAVKLLSHAIANQYHPALVQRYGLIISQDPARQLKRAEQWLNEHPDDDVLLLALARLSMANQLWGKARDYFEASLKISPSAEAYAELARLLVHIGEGQRSHELFDQGLALLSHSHSPERPASL